MVDLNDGITILPELATFDMSAKQLQLLRHFKHPSPMREVSKYCCTPRFCKETFGRSFKAINSNLPTGKDKKE